MLYIVPEIVWAGITLAVYAGLLVPMISNTIPPPSEGSTDDYENMKLMKSMYAMMSIGVGEIVGSLAIGRMIDKAGNKLTSILTLVLIVLQTVLILLFLHDGVYGPLVFIMTFVCGV